MPSIHPLSHGPHWRTRRPGTLFRQSYWPASLARAPQPMWRLVFQYRDFESNFATLDPAVANLYRLLLPPSGSAPCHPPVRLLPFLWCCPGALVNSKCAHRAATPEWRPLCTPLGTLPRERFLASTGAVVISCGPAFGHAGAIAGAEGTKPAKGHLAPPKGFQVHFCGVAPKRGLQSKNGSERLAVTQLTL